MTAVAMCAAIIGMALGQLIISLHVEVRGGGYWKRMIPFWISVATIAAVVKLLTMWGGA